MAKIIEKRKIKNVTFFKNDEGVWHFHPFDYSGELWEVREDTLNNYAYFARALGIDCALVN